MARRYLFSILVVGSTVLFGANQLVRGEGRATGSPDQKFILQAARAGLTEIRFGKLARKRGYDAGVRRFGDQMVRDHTEANKRLRLIADRRGMTLPSKMDRKHRALYDKLSRLQGAEFD